MAMVLVFALCLVIVDHVAADPCLTYDNFTADSTRSPGHVEPEYNNKICDAVITEKWYRLVGDAGTDLTNDSGVLVSNGCGTSYQIWMNGTVPDVSGGIVDRQACVRSPFSSCHSSYTIQVKNCCSFRVYYLKSATNCPQAYCVSPSSVLAVDCPTTMTTTTTTSTTTTTTTTTTTAASTTTSVTKPTASANEAAVNNHVTIVNTISKEIIITIVILMVIITVILVGIVAYKSYKCSKVGTENQFSRYIDQQNHPQNVFIDVCDQVPRVEKGGINSRETYFTCHA